VRLRRRGRTAVLTAWAGRSQSLNCVRRPLLGERRAKA